MMVREDKYHGTKMLMAIRQRYNQRKFRFVGTRTEEQKLTKEVSILSLNIVFRSLTCINQLQCFEFIICFISIN
jgi:hypothetical protein